MSFVPVSYMREFRQLGTLTAPLVVTQVSQMGMTVVDVVVTGRYGYVDQAGVGLATSLFWPIMLLLTGTLMAVTPTVAQLNGARRVAETGFVVRQALWLALFLAIVIIIVLHNVEPLYRFIGVDEKAIPISVNYLRAVSFGIPALLGYFVLKNLCEGMGMTVPSMVILISALTIKIPLTYALVFGIGEFSGYGGVGCGVATACIMWFQLFCIVIAVSITRIRHSGVFTRFDSPRFGVIGKLTKLGFPIGLTIFVEVSFFSFAGLMIGKLGAQATASHQIAMSIGGLGFMIPLALGMASTIRVGTNVGAGRFHVVRRTVSVASVVGLGIALVVAVILLTLRHQIVSLYSEDSEVIALAAQLLLLCALFQVFDASQVVSVGALRGFKDTTVPMILATISYWALGMPVGYVLAFGFGNLNGIGAIGFWYGLVFGLFIAAILQFVRLRWVTKNAAKYAPTDTPSRIQKGTLEIVKSLS